MSDDHDKSSYIDVTVRHAKNKPGELIMHCIFPAEVGTIAARDIVIGYIVAENLSKHGKVWVAAAMRKVPWKARIDPTVAADPESFST